MDDHVRAQLLEEGAQAGLVGDVALAVGGAGDAVLVAAQVDRGDGAGGPLGAREGLRHDVVAEEAVAADDEDVAEVVAAAGLLRGRHGFGLAAGVGGGEVVVQAAMDGGWW